METLEIDGFNVYFDSEDDRVVSAFDWKLAFRDANLYALTYRRKLCLIMHRLITGPTSGEIVYHFNEHTLDNRKNNLIIGKTKSQGQTGTSKFRGVYWEDEKRMWRAVVWDAETKHSTFAGRFNTEDEAAAGYDEAATKLFGKYARLNFEGGDAR